MKCEYIGSEYGGFPVVLEILDQNSVVFDIGVGEDVSFAEEIIKRVGCRVELFDFTPASIEWFNQNITNNKMNYNQYGVSDHTGFIHVHAYPDGISRRPAWMGWEHNETYEVKSVKDIMFDKGISHIDVLKMDIEGEEYSVLPNMIENEIFPTQICVEFHARLLNGVDKSIHNIVVDNITKHYNIIQIHGNEVCFLLKDN